MFVCTFYSYKGGVGRTLALANVAIEHARQGKKVLTVDFDLEAPGLSTLNPFDQAGDKPGLIDFVRNYQFHGEVPDTRDFIYQCRFEDADAEFHIDVMPAGCGERGYSEAFSSIDWNDLYENQNGFLLMEDLRAQWKAQGYDYVYIDSRTGHTDSGGICTRQLPDAVAVVFFPNAQNLRGLRQTVPAIRESEGRPVRIETVFVASRVPKLDDEHGLLRQILKNFQNGLGYEASDLVLIEQYDSLSLLDQELFVLTRPTSGLAKQYQRLASRLSQLNVEDADGVAAYLKNQLRELRVNLETPFSSAKSNDDQEDSLRLPLIAEKHEGDALIQYLLARVFYFKRNLVSAAIASDKVLAAKQSTKVSAGLPDGFNSRSHQLRLSVYSELQDEKKIVESANAIIKSDDAGDTAILDAIINLANFAPERLPELENLPALANAEPRRLLSVARRLTWNRQAVTLAASLIERLLEKVTDKEIVAEGDLTDIQLPLIATGRFELAYEASRRYEFPGAPRLDVMFNTAVAKWGAEGQPDVEWFIKVDEAFEIQKDRYREPNHFECLALAKGVLGKNEEMKNALAMAEKAIDISDHIEFSCWNYQNVTPTEFKNHLKSIEQYFLYAGPPPAFLSTSNQAAERQLDL